MQVQKVLNPKLGGSLTASVEEVVARLSRAKVGNFRRTKIPALAGLSSLHAHNSLLPVCALPLLQYFGVLMCYPSCTLDHSIY